MIFISKLKLFDEQNAIKHVRSLSFKRLAATEGETKTINYILKELEKEKVDVKVESFIWTRTTTKFRKLIFLWIFIFTLISQIILLQPIVTWIILPLDGLFFVVLFLLVKIIFDHTRMLFIGKRRESKNAIVTIQAKDLYPKRPVVFFSAHHDSVSSNFPAKITMKLLFSILFMFLSYLLINLALSIWSIIALFPIVQIDISFVIVRNISLIIGSILLIEDFITFFIKKTNQSVGSIDNASGIAILIELAKLVKINPLEKTDVIFLWCGAEEMGLWGSKQYLSSHFEELDYDYDLNKSYNINIDMVGTYVGIVDETGLIKKKKLNKNLNDVLEASATHLNVPFKKASMAFGSGSDHLVFQSFAKKAEKPDFQVSCFLSKDDSKYIHSKKDLDKYCSGTNLNACIEICFNAIKSLDLRVD